MFRNRWAVTVGIFVLLVLGFFALRYFYWLMQPGLPVYP